MSRRLQERLLEYLKEVQIPTTPADKRKVGTIKANAINMLHKSFTVNWDAIWAYERNWWFQEETHIEIIKQQTKQSWSYKQSRLAEKIRFFQAQRKTLVDLCLEDIAVKDGEAASLKMQDQIDYKSPCDTENILPSKIRRR